MTTKQKNNPSSRISQEIAEAAKDLNSIGLMSDAECGKITMRHKTAGMEAATLATLTPDEIRAVRQQANMSQAVFARHLNLTVSYVSQLERGAKRPTGAALALLNIVRRKGIEVFR